MILGLDSGLTSTKAVIFDHRGRVTGSATAPTPRSELADRHSERDPDDHWATTARVIADAVRAAGHPDRSRPREIEAIALAGHGDGLYLVDDRLRPVGPAVLSSDTRATPILRRWATGDVFEQALRAGGTVPFAGSPAPLLAWFADHEPMALRRARWLLTAKDWLRARLTGSIATDPTDAASSFTDHGRWDYSDELLGLFGLSALRPKLPPIRPSASVAGTLTAAAAGLTGLPAGLPVITGLHDVTASHLGTAGPRLGQATVIAGTFGVNVALADRPVASARVTCRPGPVPGRWTLRRTSPASGANLDWAVSRFAPTGAIEGSVGPSVDRALAAPADDDAPCYLPYLFGGPWDGPQTASLLGLRAAHTEVDLLRAVLYGVTFTHRTDLELVCGLVPVETVHLAGGAAANPRWAQLFADVLERPIEVTGTGWSAALGAALCGAVAIGAAADLATAFALLSGARRVIEPDPDRWPALRRGYATFLDQLRRS
ncbi:FGGY-family carbohydrate kinase [Microlunatus speluncae]|uniref:FGGY-family carbohydrate kinase n=1 Tax=Microlunatus speluncae TaxID=2594267 RepID=UPI0012662A13|nr:FGGY family carbohydrate kinase [Microlunatus speluncae]